MQQYNIPALDLVVVDLYPFQETVAQTSDEQRIIEKIDIGGPSMIRAAAKNFSDVTVLASKDDYAVLVNLLQQQGGAVTLEQRKRFAARAFRDRNALRYCHQRLFQQTWCVGTSRDRRRKNPALR
jgi:phosphoribosylaminoimidazolecarboxamide formyltransferase/IMP cyclohydrolase